MYRVLCISFAPVCLPPTLILPQVCCEILETSPRRSYTIAATLGILLPELSKYSTKLLIEDYIIETTSALLYLFSLPSPNSQTSSFSQPEASTPQITSIYPATHHSPPLARPRASSADVRVKSVRANLAPAEYSSDITINPTLSFQEKKSFFLQSRQTFGSTALVLQGGSVFGLCHVGVVRGLWKRGLLPRIFVGWGVGGLIASLGIDPLGASLM
jgi:hypothetical protein